MFTLLIQWFAHAANTLQGVIGVMRTTAGPVTPLFTSPPEHGVCAPRPDDSDGSEPGAVGNAWTFLMRAFEQYNDRPFEVAAASWPPKEDVFETEGAGVHGASAAQDETHD